MSNEANSRTAATPPAGAPPAGDETARREGTEVAEFTSGQRADVIIIGGGIGGLSTAVNLTQAGLRVKVYERQRAFGEVGAGMQIASNCTRILDQMGLLEEAKRLGVLPERMVMRDALDARALLTLDLRKVEERYGYPYMVIHRSDLHGVFLRAAQALGVELHGGVRCVDYATTAVGARVTFDDGSSDEADVVIAADGLHSIARKLLVDDEPVNSAYVAYRGAVPIDQARDNGIDEQAVQVYIGPGCHFVQYGLRAGEMFNQVAVFESPKALAGEEDWGTPDELDAAFTGTCAAVQKGLPLMWRDRWWRMFDRNPIMTWVTGRIALLGDAAHPPLQYMAQGAIMAIEDGWVLGQHVRRQRDASGAVDWDAVLTAYDAVRPEHCRRILQTGRVWGELWHLHNEERLQRNAVLDTIDPHDWAFTDWVWGPTALVPEEEPEMFVPIPLASGRTAQPVAG
ncbi:FAD-dependent oxidoreductase [Propioniciclava soli]|uniref:FAD-dependent oxidoreductase n=1 Tax=Propioniciclava soli TaxID=2775081 RepID=UPI001E552A5D|nr:FAD-dependent oxidoreductase [Propioniciclava soli]